MGFGDKFKDLTQQAKDRVAENREKIQEAVDAASVAANEKTHGKYSNKIMKVNQKTGGALDKFSAGAGAGAGAGTGAEAGPGAGNEAGAGGVEAAQEQQHSVPMGDPPRFADEAPVTATSDSSRGASQPAGGWPATGEPPKFDDEP